MLKWDCASLISRLFVCGLFLIISSRTIPIVISSAFATSQIGLATEQIDVQAVGEAQDGTRFRYKAWEQARAEDDATWVNKITLPLTIILALYLLMVIINLVTNPGVAKYHARDAFYPLSYQLDIHKPQKQKAYLRYLSDKKALLLCNERLSKGLPLIVNLGNLPGFPDEHTQVYARVIKEPVRISKTSKRYNVWVRFEEQDASHYQVIDEYLESQRPDRVRMTG